MKKPQNHQDVRTHLIGSGVFVSVPEVFSGAENALSHFAKVNLAIQSPRTDPTKTEAVVLSDRILFDIEVLNGINIDINKLIADCDIVRKAATNHPKQLQVLIDLATKNDFAGAAKISGELGLTEEASLREGGGLLWLVAVVVLAVAASGCRGCAHNAASTNDSRVRPNYGGKDGGN